MPRTLAASASALLGLALWFSYGTFSAPALALATLGLLAGLAALFDPGWNGAPRPERPGGAVAVLGLAVTLGLVSTMVAVPGDPRLPPRHPYVVSLAAVALALVLTYGLSRAPRWLVRARFPLLLVVGAALMLATLLCEPRMFVDVGMFRHMGSLGLAHGWDPYALLYPNIYPHTRMYGPGWLEAGEIAVYPYPPLTALVDLPFATLFGDIRWASLVLILAGAALVSRLGRDPCAELAAAFVLFQPRTTYLLKGGWTEPLVLVAWVGALLLVARWRARGAEGWALAGLGVGALLSAKQYSPLLAAPLVLCAPPGRRRQAALIAVSVTAALLLPFALWHGRDLWHDLVLAQLEQPFRHDALSWLVVWARWRGTEPTPAVGFVLALAALALVVRGRGSPGRSALAAGTAFAALVLFNKQAFCNYYWLASGVFASACAVAPEVLPAACAVAPEEPPELEAVAANHS